MSFFKKYSMIEIITPMEGNLDVQAFAGQYAKTGTPIEVEVHGSLYCSDGKYAIDNRRGLRREYLDSIRLHSVESCMIFKDILEREGLLVL